eukprot:Gregarina_sp_Poly_1__3399@NODE_1985_length_2938_cov_10_913967_g1279_i0_p1_GENE_NODE_1985_length_2938_cov_10_913967_g1279_i0NODE_1985_length_2938_cov_10_913967_g1279_i0_p1_ORF_typecomplete_len125_score9_22_NODE_1985_length_2938_cov_10_913967_g1279_i0175549
MILVPEIRPCRISRAAGKFMCSGPMVEMMEPCESKQIFLEKSLSQTGSAIAESSLVFICSTKKISVQLGFCFCQRRSLLACLTKKQREDTKPCFRSLGLTGSVGSRKLIYRLWLFMDAWRALSV